jgi:hypothetical protein
MKKTPRPCTPQPEIVGRSIAESSTRRAERRQIAMRSNSELGTSAGRPPRPSPFSGAELSPFQPAGLGAGGATAMVGLFEFTLRLGHDFAQFR